jgi:hypothetical protein
MPDWQSPAELATDYMIFIRLIHALTGIYVWELVVSFDFDWAVLTGKKKFRWPLAVYFTGRYLLLIGMIGILVALHTTVKGNCHVLYVFNQFTIEAAVGLASINLAFRTIALWSQNKWIIALIALIALGHWTLILEGLVQAAIWHPSAGCAIVDLNTTILTATFVYSMCFNVIMLCLTAYQLARSPPCTGVSGLHHKLFRMIFSDGLVHFILACLANLLATTFLIMDLNSVMSILFNVPAAAALTIVASRAVRRFWNAALGVPEVYISEPRSAMSGQTARPAQGGAHGTMPTAIRVEVDTFLSIHPKPSSDDFISFGDEEQKRSIRMF